LFTSAALAACVDDNTTPTADLENALRQNGFLPNGVPMKNPTGMTATISSTGNIDLTNEFFQNLGINGRRCVSCHLPTAGFGTTPSQIQAIFDATDGGLIDDDLGLGAMFRTNDGSVSPTADVSTLEARRQAYSMLLNKGLIRVSMPIPATGDFDLVSVDDPYGHSSPADVSEFRRPLPSTNLKFLSAVMWDGRETFAGQTIHFDLSDQANGATQGHAQSPVPLTTTQREDIVNFETALATAATFDDNAKDLHADGANGGPDAVQAQVTYIGINDLFGDSRTGAPFNPVVFNIYDAWDGSNKDSRAAVARGQALFNTRTIQIVGVGGINDNPLFGKPPVVAGTCTTCHDSPNGGNHSTSVPLNIGLVDASRRTADLPLYTLQCNSRGIAKGHCAAGDQKTVTDIGRGMISGNWIDIGKFKGPILRGLAARAPYFHNGSAATLDDAVDFYNNRFNMHLTAQEHSDIVAFLRTL
jgi:hypothetical protein